MPNPVTPHRDLEWFTIPPGMMLTPIIDNLFHAESEDLHVSYRHVISWGHVHRGNGEKAIGLFLDARVFPGLDNGMLLIKDGPWVDQLEGYTSQP